MVGGGLLSLTSYGTQNVLLSGNPDFTFFYKTFRKYSHFSQENYTVALDGPNELQFDSEITLRAKIPRVTDLVSDLYFSFRLPDIFSKYDDTKENQYEFQWVKMIGARIIRLAGIYIGGYKIQEIDADYIMAKALVDYPSDQFKKWETLVGNIPDLTDPANGSHPGGNIKGNYPHVVYDPDESGPQTNNPSIPGYTIHVPIPFWFTEAFSQSLPLVGLEYHDVDFRITLAPIRDLYTILDISGYRVRPGFQVQAALGQTPSYHTSDDISGYMNHFLIDFNNAIPSSYSWNLNPSIDLTYTYVTSEERKVFATQPLSYLIYQPHSIIYENITNIQLLEIEIHNPITRMMFLPRRSDSTEYCNDWTNLTNWWQYPKAPFTTKVTSPSSGKLISGSQKEIIRAIRVLANGNEIQQQKTADYFQRIVPWKNLTGNPGTIPVYSFQLNQSDIQPSGSLNSSRIRLFQVELDVFPLPPNTTYVYNVTIYLETINWFLVQGGYGGIKYNI